MKVRVHFDFGSDGEVLTPEEAGVREVMDVPDGIPDEDVSGWISDKTGWCVFSWEAVDVPGATCCAVADSAFVKGE